MTASAPAEVTIWGRFDFVVPLEIRSILGYRIDSSLCNLTPKVVWHIMQGYLGDGITGACQVLIPPDEMIQRIIQRIISSGVAQVINHTSRDTSVLNRYCICKTPASPSTMTPPSSSMANSTNTSVWDNFNQSMPSPSAVLSTPFSPDSQSLDPMPFSESGDLALLRVGGSG